MKGPLAIQGGFNLTEPCQKEGLLLFGYVRLGAGLSQLSPSRNFVAAVEIVANRAIILPRHFLTNIFVY